MLQNMLLEEFYPRNRKENGNPLCFYQKQCNQLKNNDKKYIAIGHTLFKLNFGKNPWKEDLIVKTGLPRLKDFFEELQSSWKVAKKLMKMAKDAIKK